MLSLIKNTFKDVWNLYLQFFHWVLSKICISASSVILAIITVLPLIIVLGGYFYFSNVAWKEILVSFIMGQNSLQAINSISTSVWDFSFGVFLIIFTIVVWMINLLYGKTLYFNTCLSYAEGKKLKITKNEYLNYGLIWKHFQIRSLYVFLLILPAIISFLIISGIVMFVWANEISSDIAINWYNSVSVIIGGLVFLSIVLFLLIRYRLLFSFVILAEKKDTKKSAFSYMKESFWITKGLKNLSKFIGLMLVFLILFVPFNIFGTSLENKANKIQDYLSYTNSNKDNQELYLKNNPYYIQGLVLEFDGMTQEELIQNFRNLQLIWVLYSIFTFIVLFGVFERVWVSFYLRELKKSQTLGEKAKKVIEDLTEKKISL